MNQRTIRAIVFDLDDTLYPERTYVRSGFEAVARAFESHLGDPRASAARMTALFNAGARMTIFNQLLSERGLDRRRDLLNAMIDTYRCHRPIIELHPDADAALRRLRPRFRLGVLSDGRCVSQHLKVEALGLADRIDKLVVSGDLGPEYAKPSLAPFELIADELHAKHEQCVYVADNPAKDFIGPNQLNWLTVHIRREDGIYRDESPAPGGEPAHRLNTLDELDVLIA